MKQFSIGARISEPTYGVGSVIAIEDTYTRIQFDEHGVKKFLTSLANLESSKVPAPERLKSGKPRRKRKTAVAKTIKTARKSKTSKTVVASK